MVKAALLKFIDEVVGAWVCWAMTSPQRTEEDPAFDATPGRILVIRPGGIGDAVMALPMLTRLHERYPDRAIDILCESRNAGLLRLAFPAWTLLTYDSHPWRTLSALRRGGDAAVLDTEQFHSFSGVFTAWTRAPIRIGFKINVRRNALYTHLVNYDLAGREDLQFAALLSALTGEDESSRLPSKDGILRHAAADTPLPEPLAAVQRPVLIHVEGRVREKMLPDATLVELCDALGDMKDVTPLLVGGHGDRQRAERIQRQCRAASQNWCGKLSLAEMMTLCRRSTAFLGGDSGIAHVANAVGAPCILWFGPTDPKKWGPAGSRSRAITRATPCGPCAIFGYNKPCRLYRCLAIPPDAILAALRSL